MILSKGIYSLPFKKNKKIRVCDAPYHLRMNAPHCIDFYMPEGTPILAARAGTVFKVEDKFKKSYKSPKFASKCNLVMMEHKDKEKTVYVHLKYKSLRVKVGDKVKRGQLIALSGQTGYAAYPHLHFGLYKGKYHKRKRFKKNLKPRMRGLKSIKFESYKKFENL